MVIENDAVNCYDRILKCIAVLALSRAGLPHRTLIFMLKFLQSAHHHIMIGGKPSDRCYADSVNTPIEGTGHGTGWSPPTWLSVADIILTALTKHQPGMLLTSPAQDVIDFRTAEKHGDDSRQGINEGGVEKFNTENETNLTLEEAANRANQAFERYLSLSGGKLAGEKRCFMHCIQQQVGTGTNR